jgi:diguanylate cyclase (GGDEF)-like protein/PAS domain S-box-containing protein
MGVLSSVRAYVSGESVWSKAQKEAVIHLNVYARTRDESDYQNFLKTIDVPLGDNEARIELQSPNPNHEIATQGYIKGKNHPNDIQGMIYLFRLFQHTSLLKPSIQHWTNADVLIQEILQLAKTLNQQVLHGQASSERIDSIIKQINEVSIRLTPLEDAFTDSISEASRKVQMLITIIMVVVTVVLMTLGVLFTRKLVRRDANYLDEIKSNEERWQFALEGAGEGVWDWNITTDHVLRSARWCEIFGYSPHELTQTATAGRQLIHPDDLARQLEEMQAYLQGKKEVYESEFRMLCKDGTWKWTLSRGMIISKDKQGEPTRMIGTHADISERKNDADKMFRLAHFDPVTNLPNRVLFADRFQQMIKANVRNAQQIALLFLDLDHFKEVNDTLGHEMGDVLLQEAAKRLLECVRLHDTVARMGGDEFTVILNDIDNHTIADNIAQKILSKLTEPYLLRENLTYITASIGISIYPNDGQEVDVLLKNADQAMYAAKDKGRNCYHYFTASMQAEALQRMQLSNDLRAGLADNQFFIDYQPIVNLNTGAIEKAEALIRWQHPVHGLILPMEFIPIAEHTGLIVEIGDWVFSEAVAQLTQWRKTKPDFQISINRSPVQFRANVAHQLNWVEQLQAHNLPGNSLCIEITEGLLLDARDAVIHQLNDFREANIQLSIDDFGTGYSSLAYLRKFNIDFVKIDKSFTTNISDGSSDMALCEAIIVMAHKLGKKVVAEGIETQTQLDMLVAAGCDFGQGYLLSKPVSASVFEMLDMQNRASVTDA